MDIETRTNRERDHVKIKAETGEVHLQAKECLQANGLLESTRSKERGMEEILPQSLQKELILLAP